MGGVHESLFVDVDGPVHVADFGGPDDAPVVLCVHGLAGSAAAWRALAEALPSYRVLAVDLPGHGRSPTTGRPVSVVHAAGVLEAVIAQLDLGPVTLVGHSMGAAVSLLTAAAAPDSVEGLLLLAPPLPRQGMGFVSPAVLPHVALCLWPRLGLIALQRRMARQTLEEHVWSRLRLTCASIDELPEVAGALAETLASELQAAYDSGEDPLESFIHAARSVGILVTEGSRYRDALTQVQAPVSVVHGLLDRVVKPSGLRQLRTLQPGWRIRLLPDVGHSPHLEAPAEVAHMLEQLVPDAAYAQASA